MPTKRLWITEHQAEEKQWPVCWHLIRVRPVAGRVRGLLACCLAVEGGAVATFVALDLLLFFVAFETVLVPMWFVVAVWSDDRQP